MSWLSDRTGIHINSINDVTSGRALKEAVHNPLVDAGLALAIPGVGGLVSKGIGALTGAGGAAAGAAGTAGAAHTIMGLTIPQLLSFGGNLAGGIADYAQGEQRNKQQQQLVDLQRNQQALGVQNQLNRAPLADRAQYLASNFAPPQAFQPRDYTRGGFGVMNQPMQGGAQAQLQANNAAANNYQPGAGGVNTDTMKAILARLGYGS